MNLTLAASAIAASGGDPANFRTVHSQPSFIVATRDVEVALTREGVATAVALSADQPTSVNYIEGAVKISAGFENVRTLEFTPGAVTFVSTTGRRVTAPVHHEFVKTGQL